MGDKVEIKLVIDADDLVKALAFLEHGNTAKPQDDKQFLTCNDVAQMFSCGRNKAMKIMKEVGPFRTGRRLYVRRVDLESYMDRNQDIQVAWKAAGARRASS